MRAGRVVLALSSAVLLVISFPGFNQPWAAWMALVPWLILLCRTTPRHAFAWSYLIGLLFFLGSIWWLVHVTVIGWLVLCAYLALYFAVFGWIVSHTLDRRHETGDQRPQKTATRHGTCFVSCLMSHVSCLLVVPSAWVSLEYLRSHVLSGFGWNLLGYSQASWLPVIQIAEVTGVWGVSFLVVMANAVIARLCVDRTLRRQRALLIGVGCMLIAVVGYGQVRLWQPLHTQQVTVAVAQGNIPQEQKWDEAAQEMILQRYERLTQAAAASHPDLIIWPETSVPAVLGWDRVTGERLQSLAQSLHAPLLVGAPIVRPSDAAGQRISLFNSALLFNGEGRIIGRYDKLHLVPFGEFIPFESTIPWLRSALPPIGDFLPGREYTVFQAPSSTLQIPNVRSSLPFSVLICFEDIFPELARRFVQRGAQMLVVITNDAWFGKTAAAYQHAQASVLRAVELRVPVVRAANTGWSGCITESGRWIGSVRDAQGEELFVEGVAGCELAVRDAATLYQRWGDWWAILCVLLVAGFAIITRLWRVETN